jgi:hypothetical protein
VYIDNTDRFLREFKRGQRHKKTYLRLNLTITCYVFVSIEKSGRQKRQSGVRSNGDKIRSEVQGKTSHYDVTMPCF